MKESEFAKVGIAASLSPWFELGHIDRGRSLQEGRFVLLAGSANDNGFEEKASAIENVPSKVIRNIDKNGNIIAAPYSNEGYEITIHMPWPYLCSMILPA